MRALAILSTLLLASLLPALAWATPVTFTFDGVILDASDAPADLAQGALISGTLTYDTAATSNGQSPSGGGGITESYTFTLAPGEVTLSILFASSATAESDNTGIAIVRDDPAGGPTTDAFIAQNFNITSPLAITALQWSSNHPNQPTGLLSDTTLDPGLPLLPWSTLELNFFTTYNSALPAGRIRAGLSNVQPVAAPEPSTALLLASGLGVLAWRRRGSGVEAS